MEAGTEALSLLSSWPGKRYILVGVNEIEVGWAGGLIKTSFAQACRTAVKE